MRYKELTVKHCDIDAWWIVIKYWGLIAVNNTNRPQFKLKLARGGKR